MFFNTEIKLFELFFEIVEIWMTKNTMENLKFSRLVNLKSLRITNLAHTLI